MAQKSSKATAKAAKEAGKQAAKRAGEQAGKTASKEKPINMPPAGDTTNVGVTAPPPRR